MELDRNQMICRCMRITVKDVIDAYNNGATTYQELFKVLNFGVGCGGCRNKIKQLIYIIEE